MGPVLVALFLVVGLLSPTFASGNEGVGTGSCSMLRLESPEDFNMYCCPQPVAQPTATVFAAQPGFRAEGETDNGYVAPWLQYCNQSVDAGPAAELVPLPPKVTGPTVLGAISMSTSGDTTTLQFPELLVEYFNHTQVRVTTDNDGSAFTLYVGPLPRNGTITFTAPDRIEVGELMLTGTLFNGAGYMEMIG